MGIQFFCFIILSIITAAFIEKRYKVATISHAILFIFLSFVYLFTTNFDPIVNMWINSMGEDAYINLHEALISSVIYTHSGLSALLVLELCFYVIVPLLSVVAIIDEMRKESKTIRVGNGFNIDKLLPEINLGINPNKDYTYTLNKTYLRLNRLLN